MLILYGVCMKKKIKTYDSTFYSSSGLSSINQLYNDTSDNNYLRIDDSTLERKENENFK